MFRFSNSMATDDTRSIRKMVAHGLRLTSRRSEIIEIMLEHGDLNINDIMAKLKDQPAQRTLRDDMIALKKSDIVDSRGHAKTSMWFIKVRS